MRDLAKLIVIFILWIAASSISDAHHIPSHTRNSFIGRDGGVLDRSQERREEARKRELEDELQQENKRLKQELENENRRKQYY